MSDKVGALLDDPIITIDRKDDENFYIDDCPGCGEDHSHGAEDLSAYELTPRVAHCGDNGFDDYWLIQPPDVE